MGKIKIGILTSSDRAATNVYEDISGKEIIKFLNEYLISKWEIVYLVLPDEKDQLESAMVQMADQDGCCLVISTGGTGPALRDVIPEATESVCEKMLPGFGELMRNESLKYVPTAILSRQSAGIRGSTLIINLPGKPTAIRQCLEAVFPAIPYCIDLIGGPFLEINPEKTNAYRPN
jgi:molybdopterin adenylyltransferase